jgi:NAD(P)-dependent dehydrogenase (short-subunit alcohol dehydrogenase family)
MSLNNKTVLVTGCSSGIGKTVAYGLREQGFTVYPTVRQEKDMAPLVTDGFDVTLLDYADAQSVETAFAILMQKTQGQLFAVFHNGAYGQPGGVEDISREAMEKQFASNFFGWHQLNNLILPIMRKQGYGRILVNSSVLGIIALPMRGAYNASKFALEGLFDTLRLELHGTDIHISLIEPGPIASDFRKNAKKAFDENILNHPEILQASPHQTHYQDVIERLNKEGKADPFTLPPEAVLKKVLHALNSRYPRLRYPVTFPTHFLGVLKRILPHRCLDWVLRRAAK